MITDFNGKLLPQEAEGITKVEWLDSEKSKQALVNSYANIRKLV